MGVGCGWGEGCASFYVYRKGVALGSTADGEPVLTDPPAQPGLVGAGAPGKEGLEVREARGSIPPPRWGRGWGATDGAALWGGWGGDGGLSSSAARQAGEGGCLGEGGQRGGEGARVRPPARARPSLRAMTVERGAGEGGPAAGGPPGAAQHWCGNPSPESLPRAVSSSSAGETAAPRPRAAASRGQGAG